MMILTFKLLLSLLFFFFHYLIVELLDFNMKNFKTF